MRKSIHYIFFLRRFKMKKDSLMSFCLLSKYPGTRLCSFLLTSHWACPLSTLIQEDLKLSLMVAAAWRDVAQLKGEGAAFVESKVCSLISQFGRKCSFMNVFMCAFYPCAHFFCIFYCFLQVLSPEQGASLLQLKTRRNAAGNFSSRRWRVKWYVGEECLISTTRMLCHPLPSSCRAWDEVHAEVRLFISTWFLQQICVSRCSSWNLKLPNCVRPISLLVHLWQSALLAASLCTMQPGLIDFGGSGTLSAASGMIE